MGHIRPQLVALCAVICAVGTAAGADPQVTTHSGDLTGATLKSFIGNSFYSFRGIPYAEPPVGEMRFRPPQPHRGWSGLRKAKMHGNKCMQFSLFSPGVIEGAEDCLFLNVYTPSLPKEDGESPSLPVMVWIHGGGFVTGSGDFDLYGPDYLMDEQLVLVTINYRLGPFGFLTTADEAAPGNYGLYDQVLALEWVQANIAAFGGNPDEVTIFGNSAGGASVGLHVLSPRSRGLFARAISQSGAAFSMFAASGEPQGRQAKAHAELLKCPTSSSREMVGCMRQKSAKEIFATLDTLLSDKVAVMAIPYKPRVDLESRLPYLPHDPYTALQNGDFNAVPWMMGLNQDEGAFYSFHLRNKPDGVTVYTGRDWSRWASSIIHVNDVTSEPESMAENVHRFYFGDADCSEENLSLLGDMLGDRFFTPSVVAEADLASAHTPVYMYLLNYTGAGRQNLLQVLARLAGRPSAYRDLGVPHAEDVLYLFRQAYGPPVPRDSEQHKMIRFIVSLWINFARHGQPTTDELPMPSWPVYTAGEQKHMQLNEAPSVGSAAFSERIQFWKQLDIRENWRMPLLNDHLRDEL